MLRALSSCASSSRTSVSARSSAKRSPAPVFTSSRFCPTRVRARSSLDCTSRTFASACRITPLVSATLPTDPASCSSSSRDDADVFASCASSERTESSYGVGSILNSTSPFFTSRFGSTGTSTTRPRTCGTTLITYFTTRTSAVDGATTFSVRMSAVSATIGMMTTVTCVPMFHGSHFILMKTNQTTSE